MGFGVETGLPGDDIDVEKGTQGVWRTEDGIPDLPILGEVRGWGYSRSVNGNRDEGGDGTSIVAKGSP